MKSKLIALGTALIFSVILFSCSESMTDLNPQSAQNLNQSNLSQPSNLSKTIVPEDAYIVVYKDQTSDRELDAEVEEIDKSEGVKADHVYKTAIKGYAARLTPGALAKLRKNPKVAYIEKDQEMSINQNPFPSWGIDRIDQIDLPLSNSYIPNSTGYGVDAYIIDTGILITHQEFEGRAKGGFSSIGSSTSWTDQNGHGTHVAGTVGGKTYGVAKKVNLIAVRVLGANGSGSTSGVVAGIDWAINHHVGGRPAVANMSLGGGISKTLDDAVQSAVNDGIVMCVAAGNSNQDASLSSPARVASAITVGASGSITILSNYDDKADYSNFGSIVDIFAPGSNITSAWFKSISATNTLSGTSMATPHVTGVAALYLSTFNSGVIPIPSQVENELKTRANDKVTNLSSAAIQAGTTKKLLYTTY